MKILIRNRLFWGTTVLMLAAGATYGCKDFLVTPAQGTLDETTLSTKAGVEGRQRLTIHAPLMTLTKAQIIRRGLEHTQGSYRKLVDLFHLPQTDYKRFLAFLSQHDCHLPFHDFRDGRKNS